VDEAFSFQALYILFYSHRDTLYHYSSGDHLRFRTTLISILQLDIARYFHFLSFFFLWNLDS